MLHLARLNGGVIQCSIVGGGSGQHSTIRFYLCHELLVGCCCSLRVRDDRERTCTESHDEDCGDAPTEDACSDAGGAFLLSVAHDR
ncbi:hypothetical protein GCM10009543_22170 [Leifsonia naganoensis]